MQILLKILSLIYGSVIFIRNKLYDLNILKSKKAEGVEVICIGNIVAGGTGKTPAVQYFVKKYLNEGKKVGILSRGYKGKRKEDLLLVRNDKEILATSVESGDEAYLHALNLKVPVVVSKDRYKGAIYLRDVCKVDIIIMDDGFQHRKLTKDKNIILIDATNPFGGNDYLPKGRLRESLESLKRADELIITKSNYVNNETLEKIKQRLSKYEKKISIATFSEENFYNMNGEEKELSIIKNKKILIFSSIANPKIFYETVKRLEPSEIEEIKFEDHHLYKSEEIKNISEKGKDYDYIVTTEKDIVKINEKIDKLLVLKMGFKIV
jgi:tetraacyldisaccharide 4'-kinase